MEFLEVDGVMMLKVDYPLAEKDADALRAYADYKFEQGVTAERERIINDLKDQFAFVMESETKEGLDLLANSIQWSERWQLSFNRLIALIKGETDAA